MPAWNFNLDLKCNVDGVQYKVIDTLENELLLCVKESDLEKGTFPIPTYVIPNTSYRGTKNNDIFHS